MRITAQFATTVTLVLAAVVASAQPAKPAPPPQTEKPAPPAAQPAAQPAPPRRAQTRPTPPQVIVRDRSGTPLRDVHVTITGAARQEIVTDAAGTASLGTMKDGSYRMRFERDGFITLERDVTLRTAPPTTIEVALSLAPPPPPPPTPPEPPPPPAPVVVTVPASRLSALPSGPPVFVSIPDFLDKNYIGREPIKESVLGCLADSTTRVLQLHEAISEHTHADMDEVLYVVAGEGTIRSRNESSAVTSTSVTAGALSVIPHGVAHAIERRGKNPLMILSMLSGAPCPVVPAGRGNRQQ